MNSDAADDSVPVQGFRPAAACALDRVEYIPDDWELIRREAHRACIFARTVPCEPKAWTRRRGLNCSEWDTAPVT